MVIFVPCSAGLLFAMWMIGASKRLVSINFWKSILMPTQSESPLLVVIMVVTSPKRAVEMLNPIPKSPKLPMGSLLEYPARTAFCSCSIDIPQALSVTSIARSSVATESEAHVTTIFLSSSSGIAVLSERNASIELSISSATHCHV